MTTHYVILSSSYSKGTRICLDVLNDEVKVSLTVEKIFAECGKDVSLSLHLIEAKDDSWQAVKNETTFLTDVEKIDDVAEFIEIINKDRKLSAMDVTRYILSTTKCTHLKLQKLLYLCYAEYLCEYNEPLFCGERICALPHGPVVSSVCDKYRHCGVTGDIIESDDMGIDNNAKIPGKSSIKLPAKSRILFSENGNRKIYSIDRTLDKYKTMPAAELVILTHRPNSPWSVTRGKDNKWGIITDKCILQYHRNEIL